MGTLLVWPPALQGDPPLLPWEPLPLVSAWGPVSLPEHPLNPVCGVLTPLSLWRGVGGRVFYHPHSNDSQTPACSWPPQTPLSEAAERREAWKEGGRRHLQAMPRSRGTVCTARHSKSGMSSHSPLNLILSFCSQFQSLAPAIH